MITVNTLQKMKAEGEKIAMLTAYESSFAALMDNAGVDVLLVGDSLGMTVQGRKSTLPVSLRDMCYHTEKRRTRYGKRDDCQRLAFWCVSAE